MYSDDGFMTLGEIVRRVSGQRLDAFARQNIFLPLGMRDTTFLPGPALQKRAETTEQRYGRWMQGEVHDPNSWTLGGVAGHAGLFSTADDMARYCQMYLNGGQLDGVRVLSPATVRAMTSPATPEGLPVRGLGWDISSGYNRRGDLFSNESFGHTGWTGTSVWIDPPSRTFVVLLTNRVHPNGQGNVLSLESRLSTMVAAAVEDTPAALRTAALAPPRPPKAGAAPVDTPASFANVQTGLDVLEAENFARLEGRHIGLVTNPTGMDRQRRLTTDLFYGQSKAGTFQLVALFAPEHGIRGNVDEAVKDENDPVTGLHVYSLGDYQRKIYKPTAEMLKGIDTLVFDIQDIGVRYYTYITTLAHVMEGAHENGVKIFVLDRPNPVNGVTVDGPALDLSLRGFAGYEPIPVRHGLTVGEMARLYNGEYNLGADLEIVPMQGWRRGMWFDQTGLPWQNPSPNIRDLTEAEMYPAIGLLESANLSVGRGTDRPFELFGAPYVNDVQLCEELNRQNLPGVSFTPVRFTPNASVFHGKECGGAAVQLLDRDKMQGARTAAAILNTLRRLYPNEDIGIPATAGMFGNRAVPAAIAAGTPTDDVATMWQKDDAAFRELRRKYLLYQ